MSSRHESSRLAESGARAFRRSLTIALAMMMAASVLIVVSAPPNAAASDLPPFCQGTENDSRFGSLCQDDGGVGELSLTSVGSTASGSVTAVPDMPQCTDLAGDTYSPAGCYSRVEFSFGSLLNCAYLDSFNRGTDLPQTGGRAVACDAFVSDHVGFLFGNHIFVDPNSPSPGFDLGLFRNYGETGRGPGEICRTRYSAAEEWVPDLTCEFPIDLQQPVDGLLGPTWVEMRVRMTVEEVSGSGQPVSRSVAETIWIPVEGVERGRRPIARADETNEGVGLENCNRIRFLDESHSHFGNPLTYEWKIELAREVGGTLDLWATSSQANPVFHFPPSVAVAATLTVTDAVNGLTDTASAGRLLSPDCGGPEDPEGGAGSIVIIESTDDEATEAGMEVGTWTLSRTDAELDALDVMVSLSGDATEGDDFRTVQRTVTFRPGETSVSIDLDPVDDATVEPDEVVTMTIEPGDGYTVGDPDAASITIVSDDRPGMSPLSPARLVDTRTGQATADGQLAGGGAIASGDVLRVPVWGRGGVPERATAVVVNTVAVGPAGTGFLTLFPCDGERPLTSSVNYGSRPLDVNNALVKLSADGALCVYTESETHLVMDVTAFAEGSEALTPKRLADSRRGQSTDDGEQAGFGRVAAGSVTTVQVAGRGGVPAGAAAVAVNVTAVRPAELGFLTLFPCDGEVPVASNLNYAGGVIRPNAAVVALSGEGTLCVFSSAETDLIVDVTASFASVPSFSALAPARLVDSRVGQQTVDDQNAGFGRVAAGSVTAVQVAGRGGVPADAAAVALNVTAIRPDGRGFFTLFPCDEEVPTASSGNYVVGDVIANSGVVKLAADGSVCVFSSAATHLAIDVNAAWAT